MEGADLLLQIGYLYIYIYHYIIIYLRQSCPIPNALGCFSLVPFVGGYVSIAPWCHEAASAKAPKAWWQRWKGGEGTNRSGTSPWKMEVFMGRSSINGWFFHCYVSIWDCFHCFHQKIRWIFLMVANHWILGVFPEKKQHTTWVALAGYFAPGLWPTTASTTITLKEGYIIPMKMLLWSHLHRGQGSAEISSHRLQLVIT